MWISSLKNFYMTMLVKLSTWLILAWIHILKVFRCNFKLSFHLLVSHAWLLPFKDTVLNKIEIPLKVWWDICRKTSFCSDVQQQKHLKRCGICLKLTNALGIWKGKWFWLMFLTAIWFWTSKCLLESILISLSLQCNTRESLQHTKI